jgi:hypothetical protein
MRLLRDEDRRTDGGVLVDMAEAITSVRPPTMTAALASSVVHHHRK